ncbi:FMN-dependent dehydrogenase-domain-containing protein [Xylaria sp. FL1042]|nr:FMN-dependent dehydrogenase-domain-containing protein [Xylaria sp. FL1042]
MAAAAAAAKQKVPYIMSTASSTSIKDVAKANGDGVRWFQMYWPPNEQNDITVSLLDRAQKAGFSVLFVTLDTYILGWRPSDMDNGNGVSDAITCACSGEVVTGCNPQLRDLKACPDDNNGACVNLLRPDRNATSTVLFFAPCQGAAYTFPHDNDANRWGQCQSGDIICCVGKGCPPNPKQPVNPRGG